MIGYVLVTIAIGFATIILVYEAYGYGIDTKSGDVVQNGLLFVNSQPGGSDVYINGAFKGQVDQRLNLDAGDYNLELRKAGYRNWQRNFTLDGQSIERVVYPLLFPSSLAPQPKTEYAALPHLLTQSPDRKWLLVQPSGTAPQFEIYNTQEPTDPRQNASIPSSVLALTASSTLQAVEWSSDNRNVLLKHTNEVGVQYIIFDHQEPSNSVNINQLFGFSPTEVSLRDKKIDQVYMLNQSDGTLRIGDIRNKTISAPILNKVLSYATHGKNLVLFTTNAVASANTVQARIWDDGEVYQLSTLPVSSDYHLAVAKYDDAWYYGLSATASAKAYFYKNPLEDLKKQTPLPVKPFHVSTVSNPVSLSFSANAQFIAISDDTNTEQVYDLEQSRNYRFEINEPLAEPLTWMDGHRLVAMSANRILVVDFDGSNKQLLSGSVLSAGAYFDTNYRYMYSLTPTQNAVHQLNVVDLQRPDEN